jgi:hypothetical protein
VIPSPVHLGFMRKNGWALAPLKVHYTDEDRLGDVCNEPTSSKLIQKLTSGGKLSIEDFPRYRDTFPCRR